MSIKKGDRFLCIKSLHVDNKLSNPIGFIEGGEYLSEKDMYIMGEYEGEKRYAFSCLGSLDYRKYFKRILSNEEKSDLIQYQRRNCALSLVAHKEKGGNYKIQTDRASVQFGDTWLRAVVYECLDTSLVYVREYENFKNRFVNV